MTAPRIDTVRRDTNQLIHRIGAALEHLDDLHAIGWYRHTNGGALDRRRGGSVDYALDTHGDPAYRAAYEHLARTLIATNITMSNAIGQALTHFTNGKMQTRRDTSADATSVEVIGALGRQAKRRATGGGTTLATVTQPMPTNARKLLQNEKLRTDLDTLRTAVRKTGGKPDRARLTPLELTAWQTAQGTLPKRKKR